MNVRDLVPCLRATVSGARAMIAIDSLETSPIKSRYCTSARQLSLVPDAYLPRVALKARVSQRLSVADCATSIYKAVHNPQSLPIEKAPQGAYFLTVLTEV